MAAQAERSPPCGISVLISGSGLGGLMTALECWRKGCDVRIFERSTANQTQGDSFTLGPNSLNAFKNWPELDKRNDEIIYRPLFAYHNHKGERLQGPFDLSNVMSKKVQRSKRMAVTRHSRPEFHGILLEQLDKCGLQVEYGKEVVNYFEDAANHRAGVVLKDGSKHEADLVVAADGIRGASWPLIAGHPIPAKSSGKAILRVAYPVELILDDPVITERFQLGEDKHGTMEMWIGPDINAFFWRNDKEMTWALQRNDSGAAEESWNNKVHPDEALKLTSSIEGWPEVADRVIKATPADRLVDWKLMWREPQPNNVSPGGHVVQVGDAAHTFLPSSGQGGTQAMEDGISLATCIAIAGSKENIPSATRVHNLLRFERVSCLQAFGVANNSNRNTKKHSEDDKKYELTVGKWILEHDPEKYAAERYTEALQCLNEGKPFQNTNIPPGMEYRPWTIDGLMDAKERGEPTVLDGDWS